MNDFLHLTYFDNTVLDYLWCSGGILLVLLLRRYIAKVLGSLLYRLFRKFTKDDLGKPFIDLLLKPIAWVVVLVAVYMSFLTLNYPAALDFEIGGRHIQSMLFDLMQVLFIISLSWIGLRLIDYLGMVLLIRAEKTESKMDDQLIPFVKDFLKVILVVIIIFFIMSAILKLNVNSLMAGIGIGGLAIALAAQQSLENLLGSFTIFLDKPFTVGDFIQVGDVKGTVEKVGFRSTRIRTIEKSYLTLPNKLIVDSILNNLTLRTFRRVRFMVGVTYNTNIDQVKAIVKDIQKYLDDHSNTNQDGIVGFHEFGDSALNILVQYYADHSDWNTFVHLKEEINFRIMEIVKKHGSEFAFPTHSVHLIDQSSK